VIRLTRRRLERAREIRDEWRRHAVATAPADRPAAERAVRRLYEVAGRPPPRFVWADSPAGALQAVRRLSDDHREAQRAGFLGEVACRPSLPSVAWRYEAELRRRGRLAARLRRGAGHLGQELSAPPARVRPLIRDRLLSPPDDWGLPPFGPVLLESLRACAAPQLSSLVPAYADRCASGQFSAQEVGQNLIYRELGLVSLRPDYAERVDLMATLARSTGPWWPYPDACVMIERPARCETQPQSSGPGRGWVVLHSLDGPALAWRDGFAIHAWHGAVVPERYTTGEASAEDWLGERNAEFRRLIAERMGYAQLLDQVDAEKITSDEYGTLWRIPSHRAGDEDVVLVDVVNSTVEPDGSQRRYVLRVPPGQRVPRDAIGWTFGLPPGTYQPAEMT